MRIHIATDRDIGRKCIAWARSNHPQYIFTDADECDVYISILSEKLITEQFINSKVRCVNFHPGILPVARGAGLFSWSIINGDLEAGVTLHEIDTNIDSGPIIDICKFDIDSSATAYSLFMEGETVIYSMFQYWFTKIVSGDYAVQPQDEDRAKIYYKKHLNKAKDLTRFVRAFHFPGKESAFYINSKGEKKYIDYDN